MEEKRERYEFIIGFVAIIISLSAFKDELSLIKVDLGFISFSLSNYFFFVVLGLLFCLYFYVSERIFRNTRFGTSKFFDQVLQIASMLFVLLIVSPVLLLLGWLSYKVILGFRGLDDYVKSDVSLAVTILIGIISVAISQISIAKFLKAKMNKQQEELENEEIKDMENATKLLKDGYYSQAILEAFKVLELHLFKTLRKRELRVQRHRLVDLLQISQKEKIITANDLKVIKTMREMRNAAAYLNVRQTKQQAVKAVSFVKDLIHRNS